MNRRTWKQLESQWAAALGGQRIPVTGRHSGDVPDVDHPVYAIEVKAGRVMSPRLREGWAQAKAAAVSTGKLPMLCVTQTVEGQRDNERFVIVDLETWCKITGDGPSDD